MSYFPPGLRDFNYLRHMILMYGNPCKPWQREDVACYAAHMDESGKPDDWLYDSFLFLNSKAASGNDYCADVNLGTTMSGEGDFFAMCSPRPADKGDWDALLDFYFAPEGAVRTLDAAVESCLGQIGKPYGPKRNVVLMLPYPHITQGGFGSLCEGGPDLDFSIRRQNLMNATRARLEAETWFVDQVGRRFAALSPRHLHLLGVYWTFETVYRGWDVDDHWLLKELRRRVHARGMKFLWIPFWASYNVHLLENYRDYYFDLAFLQPNYMFYAQGTGVGDAARAAQRTHAGLEMEYYLELNEPIRVEPERHSRFRDYLNGGVDFGYMKESVCAHFQGVGSLERMRRHPDPIEREFYEDIYHFVRGDYSRKPEIPRSSRIVEARIAEAPATSLAVDLGGTNLRVALVDDCGRIRRKLAVPTPRSKEEILESMGSMLLELRAGQECLGIGVSSGGRVDFEEGAVLESTDLLAAWQRVPLREILERKLGLPVWADNDGHCAALAERMFGLGREISDFVCLALGTGIGGGVVSSGILLRGVRNAASELGHASIDFDGPLCSCGNRGCLELFASGSGLARQGREAMLCGRLCLPEIEDANAVDARALGEAARRGNPAARELVENAGRALGIMICGLLHTFNPRRVILGGSLLQLGDMYIQPLRETIDRHSMRLSRESAEIALSGLAEPGLLGAASLVFENVRR